MKTIVTTAVVEPDHRLTLELPDDVEPGRYRVTLVREDASAVESEPFVVPAELAGRCIAWDRNHSRIIASGTTFLEAIEAARATGETDFSIGTAPAAEAPFGGMRFPA
jgi:hypothetical protein